VHRLLVEEGEYGCADRASPSALSTVTMRAASARMLVLVLHVFSSRVGEAR
jgi:hypothetical protein